MRGLGPGRLGAPGGPRRSGASLCTLEPRGLRHLPRGLGVPRRVFTAAGTLAMLPPRARQHGDRGVDDPAGLFLTARCPHARGHLLPSPRSSWVGSPGRGAAASSSSAVGESMVIPTSFILVLPRAASHSRRTWRFAGAARGGRHGSHWRALRSARSRSPRSRRARPGSRARGEVMARHTPDPTPRMTLPRALLEALRLARSRHGGALRLRPGSRSARGEYFSVTRWDSGVGRGRLRPVPRRPHAALRPPSSAGSPWTRSALPAPANLTAVLARARRRGRSRSPLRCSARALAVAMLGVFGPCSPSPGACRSPASCAAWGGHRASSLALYALGPGVALRPGRNAARRRRGGDAPRVLPGGRTLRTIS